MNTKLKHKKINSYTKSMQLKLNKYKKQVTKDVTDESKVDTNLELYRLHEKRIVATHTPPL